MCGTKRFVYLLLGKIMQSLIVISFQVIFENIKRKITTVSVRLSLFFIRYESVLDPLVSPGCSKALEMCLNGS